MMKKVLYGVALTLFASVSVGSLQSCKDDVNDLATQTSYDLSKLKSQLMAEDQRLAGLIQDNADAIAGIKREYATIQYVNEQVALLDGKIDDINGQIGTINGQISDLQEADRQILEKIDGALETISGLSERVDAIDELLKDYDKLASKEYVDGQVEALQRQLDELAQLVQDGDEGLEAMIRDTQEVMFQLNNALRDEMQEQIDAINQMIDTVINALDAIQNRIDKNVSGILIQGVNNPVFGDFSLPIGIRSNILFNWYGKNVWNEEFMFPSSSEDYSATGNPGVDFAALYPAQYQVPAGFYGGKNNDVVLGTVYATINPVGAQLDHLNVNLETSAGTVLPWTVTLKPSDYELGFGYTTRSEANGFYEGDLVVPAKELSQSNLNIQIEEGLKESMKNIIKDPSRHNAKELLVAVFNQLTGKIPAYALRYGWNPFATVEEGAEGDDGFGGFGEDPGFSSNAYAVLSQYDLAVAAAKPLSYNFLAGYQGSAKLPELGHIQNILLDMKDDFHFTFDPISFNDINIHLPEITINSDPVGEPNATVTVEIGEIIVKNDAGEEIGRGKPDDVTVDGVSDLAKQITDNINTAIDQIKGSVSGWSGEADGQINAELQKELGKVADQINGMMDSINGQIDSMIDNIAGKLDPFFNRANQAFDLYNRIANKINKFLVDPNAYLQVAAFYNINGGLGIVSGRATDPTPFVQAGGKYFKLYLSSYTGELIVPACKKYVAVTKVYNKTDNGLVEDTNADLGAINTKANEEKFNNGNLDGNEIVVLVWADAFTPGKVYEFTYQALDYQGWTSTKKFYIEVK